MEDCILEMEVVPESRRNGRVIVLCTVEQKCGEPYISCCCGSCGTVLVRGNAASIRNFLWKCPCGWLNELS